MAYMASSPDWRNLTSFHQVDLRARMLLRLRGRVNFVGETWLFVLRVDAPPGGLCGLQQAVHLFGEMWLFPSNRRPSPEIRAVCWRAPIILAQFGHFPSRWASRRKLVRFSLGAHFIGETWLCSAQLTPPPGGLFFCEIWPFFVKLTCPPHPGG